MTAPLPTARVDATLTEALREIQQVNRKALRGELSYGAACGRIAVITADVLGVER